MSDSDAVALLSSHSDAGKAALAPPSFLTSSLGVQLWENMQDWTPRGYKKPAAGEDTVVVILNFAYNNFKHPDTPDPNDPEWDEANNLAYMDQKAIVEWLGRCAPWPKKRVERRLWPIFGLAFAFDRRIDLDAAFGRSAVDRSALVLEIGCGSGEALCSLAASHPDADFVGVDWFRGGLAAAMQGLDEAGAAANARLVRADAATLLRDGLEARRALDEVLVFFPDPWRSSEGRRIVRPEVVQSLSPLMQDGGRLHLATDVEGYADEARAVLASCCDAEARWEEVACDCCLPRPSTKYERDGIAAGRGVNDVCWRFVRGSVVRGCGD